MQDLTSFVLGYLGVALTVYIIVCVSERFWPRSEDGDPCDNMLIGLFWPIVFAFVLFWICWLTLYYIGYGLMRKPKNKDEMC